MATLGHCWHPGSFESAEQHGAVHCLAEGQYLEAQQGMGEQLAATPGLHSVVQLIHDNVLKEYKLGFMMVCKPCPNHDAQSTPAVIFNDTSQ